MRIFFMTLFSAFFLFLTNEGYSFDSSSSDGVYVTHCAPIAIGTIDDQTLFAPGNDCGADSLTFDVTPYFESYGEPLTYCLSHLIIDGNVSLLDISLNPFTGQLKIPTGWFGTSSSIKLNITAKNPFGSALQHMNVYLEVCGG